MLAHPHNILNRLEVLPTNERLVYLACLEQPLSIKTIALATGYDEDAVLMAVYCLSTRGLIEKLLSMPNDRAELLYASVANDEVRAELIENQRTDFDLLRDQSEEPKP